MKGYGLWFQVVFQDSPMGLLRQLISTVGVGESERVVMGHLQGIIFADL
jgi:hypothetical protein